MNKFISADRKIEELTNQLFPGGSGMHRVSLKEGAEALIGHAEHAQP